ncbi:MAG: hypothetical protein V1896_01760 [Candidatus Zambryskibacteria bacterium]
MEKKLVVLIYSPESDRFGACLASDHRVRESNTKINGSVWSPPRASSRKPANGYPFNTVIPIENWLQIISSKKCPACIVLGVFEKGAMKTIASTDKVAMMAAEFARYLSPKTLPYPQK